MTEDKRGGPVEPSAETVADLDSAGDPVGGMVGMSSAGRGECLSDDDPTCVWDTDC